MKRDIETAYEEFCLIVSSSMDKASRDVAVRNMYLRLGDASVVLENTIYERLGMSSDEIIEIIDMDSVMT